MTTIPIDYEILRLVWWLFLGVLLIGFAIMDGFDLGVAMLLPYVARTDIERRVTINAIGPVWEGNQVWLILGGGADVRGMAAGLRHVVLGLLRRHVSGPRHAHPAPGRLRISQQGCRYALADVLGLRPVRRRAGAERGVRCGVRQLVAGRSVPHRFRPARPLRGKRTVRTAQSVRPAVRPCLRRNACHSRRDLSDAEDERIDSAARARVHQDWRCAHGRFYSAWLAYGCGSESTVMPSPAR